MPRAEAISREEPQDALELDQSTLDPEKHYRFCHPRNFGRRKAQGYEFVLRSEGVRLQSDYEEDIEKASAGDRIQVGSVYLMACTKARRKERRVRNEQLAAARLSSAEQKFQTQAKQRGVRPLTGDEGEER